MSRLLIVRHGEATSPGGKRDFDRTLTPDGALQIQKLAESLRQYHLNLAYIVASPAPRTEQTARILARAWSLDFERLDFDLVIYEANVSTLLDVLAERKSFGDPLVLVGHNPGLSSLALALAPGALGSAWPGLHTGGWVLLDLPPEDDDSSVVSLLATG